MRRVDLPVELAASGGILQMLRLTGSLGSPTDG